MAQQKITPNLWFDGVAKEAAEFYTGIFPDSKITHTSYYPTEGLADFQKEMAGKELVVDFELAGLRFSGINAGPEFKFNPSISCFVNFNPNKDDKAREKLDEMWEKLSDGGEVLMALDKYPFSEHYGWVKDRYGFSWQLILNDPEYDERSFIVPSLMFGADVVNKAEEAVTYYTSIFKDAEIANVSRYEEQTGPAKKGAVMYGDFTLANQWFAFMDTGGEQKFTFNEAVSLMVTCKDQEEIDYFWEKLSTVPESEQCGWCKDKYGVSWQIVPENMGELMKRPGAFKNLMKMHKLVIADF